MRLVDSNIVIYATQPGNDWLRALLFTQPFGVSVITLVEVLYSTLILPSSSGVNTLIAPPTVSTTTGHR